jgi:hypothetical protein
MFISGIFLLLYFTNRRYKDMERYYINTNKFKYKIVLYSKYVLIFAFMYNCKFLAYNLLKKLRK